MDAATIDKIVLVAILAGIAVTSLWLIIALIRSRDKLPVLPALCMIALAGAGIAAFSPPSVDKWAKFKQEHNCRVVERREGQTTSGVGVTMNGRVGVFGGSSPSQTAYLCDDGVKYWKND